MSTWSWLVVGYAGVFGVMAGYAWRTVSRGRELARRVPDEDKPWV